MSTSNLQNQKSDYFPALTGVRAIAAYLVFFHHYNPFSESFAGGYLFDFVNEFHIGVSIFFVLSGFLIAYRYSGAHQLNLRSYFVSRITRIYPMYFILTTLTFILPVIISNGDFSGLLFLSNITFIRGFFDDLKFTGIAQGWSLTVEELFYLSAPVFFILIRRRTRNIYLLPVALLGLGACLVMIGSRMNFYGFFANWNFMFLYTFFGRCIEFFTGIWLALFFMKHHTKKQGGKFTWFGLAIIFAWVFCLGLVKGSQTIGAFTPEGIIINNFLLPVTGVALFFFGLLREETAVSKLLSSRLFILLGKSSYVFYLIHVGVICDLTGLIAHQSIFTFLMLNIIAVLLFKFVEEPLNRFLKNRLNRKQGKAV